MTTELTVFWLNNGTAQIITTRPRPDGLHDRVAAETVAFASKVDAIAHARKIGARFIV